MIAPRCPAPLPQTGFLRDTEWAEILECDPRAFRDWVRQSGIPFIPVLRQILVSAEHVYQYGLVVHDRATGERRKVHSLVPLIEKDSDDSTEPSEPRHATVPLLDRRPGAKPETDRRGHARA